MSNFNCSSLKYSPDASKLSVEFLSSCLNSKFDSVFLCRLFFSRIDSKLSCDEDDSLPSVDSSNLVEKLCLILANFSGLYFLSKYSYASLI